MKKYIILLLSSVLILSCDKDIISPEIGFSASVVQSGDTTTYNAGETITISMDPDISILFEVSGFADGLSLYTGDSLHNWENSHYMIMQGYTDEELHQQTAVLTQDSLDVMIANGLFDQDYLDDLLDDPEEDTVIASEILAGFQAIVGKEWYSLNQAATELEYELFYDKLPRGAQEFYQDYIEAYFETSTVDIEPEGGFASGTYIDPFTEVKTISYTYLTPGTYEATLVVTSLSEKQYEGDGYKSERVPVGSEYHYLTETKVITIVVN